MELARYGVPPAEVHRDPRPSRITALLEAGRAVDARLRLENIDDAVARGGMQAEVKETYPPGKTPPKSDIKTEYVGFHRRRDELLERAYPGYLAAKEQQAQLAQRDAVLGSQTARSATALKFRVVRDEDGENPRLERVEVTGAEGQV